MATIEEILAKGVNDEEKDLQKPDAVKESTPDNIINPIPIKTPQITKGSDGQPLQKYPELSVEDLEKVKQGTSVFDVIDRLYKPAELDERKLGNNRTIGIIGDSVKLLAQMHGAGKGARIRENKPNDSLTNYFLNEEKQLRDIYRKNQDAYKRMRLDATLREYEYKRQQDERLRREGREDKQIANKLDWEKEKFTEQQAAKAAKDAYDVEYKNALLKYRDKDLAVKAANQASVAADRKYRRENNQQRNSNNKDYYTKLAAKARMDPEFISNLPNEFFTIRRDPASNTEISRNLISNTALLGAAYEQYLEEKNNTQSTEHRIGW